MRLNILVPHGSDVTESVVLVVRTALPLAIHYHRDLRSRWGCRGESDANSCHINIGARDSTVLVLLESRLVGGPPQK